MFKVLVLEDIWYIRRVEEIDRSTIEGEGDSSSMKFVICTFLQVFFRALKLWEMRWAREYVRRIGNYNTI